MSCFYLRFHPESYVFYSFDIVFCKSTLWYWLHRGLQELNSPKSVFEPSSMTSQLFGVSEYEYVILDAEYIIVTYFDDIFHRSSEFTCRPRYITFRTKRRSLISRVRHLKCACMSMHACALRYIWGMCLVLSARAHPLLLFLVTYPATYHSIRWNIHIFIYGESLPTSGLKKVVPTSIFIVEFGYCPL